MGGVSSTPGLAPPCPFPRQPFSHQHAADRPPATHHDAKLPPIAVGIPPPDLQRHCPAIEQRLQPQRRCIAQPRLPAQRAGCVSGASISAMRIFVPSIQKVSPSTTQLAPPPLWHSPNCRAASVSPELTAGALAGITDPQLAAASPSITPPSSAIRTSPVPKIAIAASSSETAILGA